MMTIAGGREVLQTAEPSIYIYIDIYVYVYVYICDIHIYKGYNIGVSGLVQGLRKL